MNDIVASIERRNQTYLKLTQDIVANYPSVVEGILSSLDDHIANDCEFVDVYVREDTEFVFFIINGPEYQAGDTVITELGETIVLTDEDKHLYDCIIKVGLPIKLVNTGTTEEIATFLKDVDDIMNNADPDANVADMMVEFRNVVSKYVSNLEDAIPDTNTSETELDLSDLDEAQKAMLFNMGDAKH